MDASGSSGSKISIAELLRGLNTDDYDSLFQTAWHGSPHEIAHVFYGDMVRTLREAIAGASRAARSRYANGRAVDGLTRGRVWDAA